MNPPRFVEVATSGAVVTIYFASSRSRDRVVKIRPNASCVELLALNCNSEVLGILHVIAAAWLLIRSSFWRISQILPSSELRSKRFHSVSRSNANSFLNSAICVELSAALWFLGFPASGNPQPLTV